MSNATLDKSSAPDFTITVVLSPDDYRKPAKEELKRIAKNAKIKGFRPGKVPAEYMQKLYGRGAIAEAIGKAVDKAINDLIEEEKLEVFGQLQALSEPNLEGISFDLNEELTFVYEGGLMPSIEKVDLSGLKSLSRYTIALSEEEALEKVKNATTRFTEYIERDDIETVEDFATLVVSDEELDKAILTPKKDDDNDENAPQDPRQRYFLRAADLIEEQRNKLVGKTKGTSITLALADLADDIKERFDKVIDAEGTTTFTISKVDREALPELNEETFKKIFGEETTVTNEEEAKAEYSRVFAENSQQNLDDFALEQVIDKLAQDNKVAVPEKAVKHRLVQARADEIEKAKKDNREPEFGHDLTEADRHGLNRRLQWLAFRQNLLKQYEVELEAEDIEAGIERDYKQQISGMGLNPETYREQFFPMFKKNLLENRERVLEMTDALLNTKLLKILEKKEVLGKRKEISEKAFGEIVEAYNTAVGAEMDELRKQPLN